MPTSRLLLFSPLVTSLWLAVCSMGLCLASEAAAAPPPALGGGSAGPEAQACSGKAVGDACTLPNQRPGTCASGTCNRLDYSQGSPPRAIEEACVVCQSGPGSPPALGSGGAPPDDDRGGDDDDGGDDGGDGGARRAPAKDPPQSSSRCRVVDEPVGSPSALALALLVVVRRRRRT